jgi:myo-inositol-1-phosphate synthase
MGYLIDSIPPQNDDYPESARFRPKANIHTSKTKARDTIVRSLREKRVDVVINYLPVGSDANTLFYADCCLEAGCAFVNAIPVFVSQIYGDRFQKAGLPILGDDIKSQVGATIIHRVLTRLFEDRGQPIRHSYQLNVGGNTDFLNMLDRSRLQSKKKSKTQSVLSQMDGKEFDPQNIYIGPSDYVSWLKDNKLCFLRVEAEQFGGVPMNVEVRLSVEDSPNSAGVIMDAVRAAKVGRCSSASLNPRSGSLRRLPSSIPYKLEGTQLRVRLGSLSFSPRGLMRLLDKSEKGFEFLVSCSGGKPPESWPCGFGNFGPAL